jgi:hypothetical protein
LAIKQKLWWSLRYKRPILFKSKKTFTI